MPNGWLRAPCTKAYGRLSIMAQWRARVTRQLVVAAESFDPPPKVLSAVIQLHPLDISANESVTENLGRIVRAAFSARRKTLANALRGVASPEEISCCNIDPALRPEALSVDDYLRLATAVEQRARRA